MKIGIALGSGSARGFSHIGILDVLAENGIVPEVVAGCSIGAIVGAAYACGNLDRLRTQALAINRLNWTQFFNPSFSLDGWINREHMQMFLVKSGIKRKQDISEMEKIYGSVACDLESGKEIWITQGCVFDSVWPSMAMPGVFPPVYQNNRWLIDGGIVNPVPVSLCRGLGADIVIAVNLNADLLRKTKPAEEKKSASSAFVDRVFGKAKERAKELLRTKDKAAAGPKAPDFFDTVSRSINIAQDRITKTRLAGDPPEILLSPRLASIGLLETYRAKEAIEEGRLCALRALPLIKDTLGMN
jgi:NTE family protein